MLMVNRKLGESIVISNGVNSVVVTVVQVAGDEVKFKVKSPKQVVIYKKDIYCRVQNKA